MVCSRRDEYNGPATDHRARLLTDQFISHNLCLHLVLVVAASMVHLLKVVIAVIAQKNTVEYLRGLEKWISLKSQ